jgi:hypothetical protein
MSPDLAPSGLRPGPVELPFDPEAEPLDVARIVDALREQGRRDRERGLLTDEELDAIARERIRAFAEKAYIDPLLLERFLRPGHDWNIATDYLIRTHRRGLVARLSLLVKRAVRPVVRLYTDHLLDRQTQINQYFCHLVHAATRENVRLEGRIAGLETRCARLEEELRAARAARG